MALSLEDQARLARLQTAYDQIITGQRVTVTQSSGRRVEYGPADADKLMAEINGLKAQAAPGGRQRGALRFRL